MPVVTLRSYNEQKGGMDIVPYFTILYRVVEGLECRTFDRTAVFVDNLVRLKLLQMQDGNHMTKAGIYDELEQDPALTTIKNTFQHPPGFSWSFERTYLTMTSLGKSFCKVCLNI
jgi:hypothetical protein